MLNPTLVQSWDLNNLTSWLQTSHSVEDNSFDLKEKYRGDVAPERVRKWFSAFANTGGGLLFVGVNDQWLPIGIDKDRNIRASINRILSDNIDPPLNWDLWHTIEISGSRPLKCIYIFRVFPSISINKPHISDGKIYIRENGESKPVSSSHDLRRLFFTSNFHPEHIEQMEYELEQIKRYEYEPVSIDSLYLRYLRAFLKREMDEETDRRRRRQCSLLVGGYETILKLITEIDKEKAKSQSATGIETLTPSQNLRSKYNDLAKKVDDFISSFKGLHQI